MQTAIRCMFVLQEKHDKSPTCHVCLFDLKGQAKLAEIFNLNYTCCIISIAFNSLVHHFLIQPYPVTTLIHDPGFTTVSKKICPQLCSRACPQATNQGLSIGYQWRLVHRLPIKACSQATNQGLSRKGSESLLLKPLWYLQICCNTTPDQFGINEWRKKLKCQMKFD